MFEMFALKSFKWISNIINFTKEITFMYRAWQTSRKNIKHSVEHFNTSNSTSCNMIVFFSSHGGGEGFWA